VWLASRLSPASVDLVGARLLLVKQPLEEFRCLRRLGSQRSCQPAAGAASPSFEGGLSGLMPWRFLGRQPADGSALGLPG
jgi:hypothetical protein